MNWRLLSESEKIANKKQRSRRRNLREKRLRRLRKMEQFTSFLPNSGQLEDLLTPAEAFSMRFRTLHQANALEWLMRFRQCRLSAASTTPPPLPSTSIHTSVDAPVLQRSRRSQVDPYVLAPAAPAGLAGMSLESLVHQTLNLTPAAIIDRLRAACGSWEDAAQLAFGFGLMQSPLSESELSSIRQAQEFWAAWNDGTGHFIRAVTAGLLTGREGDWACFEHEHLAHLLPGARVPVLALRNVYLIKLEGSFYFRDLRLVLHSRQGRPLLIHPL